MRTIGPYDPCGRIITCQTCQGSGKKPWRECGWLIDICQACRGVGTYLKQDNKIYPTEGLCLHEMHGWGKGIVRRCNMHEGHRGKHCSVAWMCDGCGKGQRGQPAAYDEEAGTFCFMCAHPSSPYNEPIYHYDEW